MRFLPFAAISPRSTFAIDQRRRFKRPPYRSLAVGVALALIAAARVACDQPSLDTPDSLAEGPHHVVRVIDGDTIIVSPHVTVRLIGVNTPETVKPDWPVEPFGPEASHFTREFLAGGTARLEFDRERADRFGRHLAYVWVGNRMLNEELLRAGLARFEPQYHYSEIVKRRFRQAQKEARQEHLGIWSQAGVH